jgi:hypothetical protein
MSDGCDKHGTFDCDECFLEAIGEGRVRSGADAVSQPLNMGRSTRNREVCTMCARSRESAPGPLTMWPQLDAWVCGDRDCRKRAGEEVLVGPAFEPMHASMRRVLVGPVHKHPLDSTGRDAS